MVSLHKNKKNPHNKNNFEVLERPPKIKCIMGVFIISTFNPPQTNNHILLNLTQTPQIKCIIAGGGGGGGGVMTPINNPP